MAEVDHSESNEMTTQEIGIAAVEANEQTAVFVDPSKGTLT